MFLVPLVQTGPGVPSSSKFSAVFFFWLCFRVFIFISKHRKWDVTVVLLVLVLVLVSSKSGERASISRVGSSGGVAGVSVRVGLRPQVEGWRLLLSSLGCCCQPRLSLLLLPAEVASSAGLNAFIARLFPELPVPVQIGPNPPVEPPTACWS